MTRAAEVAEPSVAKGSSPAAAPEPTTPATSDERLRAFQALLASLPEAPAVPLGPSSRRVLGGRYPIEVAMKKRGGAHLRIDTLVRFCTLLSQ